MIYWQAKSCTCGTSIKIVSISNICCVSGADTLLILKTKSNLVLILYMLCSFLPLMVAFEDAIGGMENAY